MKLNLQKIKGKMREENITNTRLAEILGITIQALGNKLNGRTDFRHSELTKIFTILNVKKEELSNFFEF